MKIRCPNCEYQGKPKRMKNRTSMWTTGILVLAALIVPMYNAPAGYIITLLAIIAVIWLIAEERQSLCPKCGWKHVVEIDNKRS